MYCGMASTTGISRLDHLAGLPVAEIDLGDQHLARVEPGVGLQQLLGRGQGAFAVARREQRAVSGADAHRPVRIDLREPGEGIDQVGLLRRRERLLHRRRRDGLPRRRPGSRRSAGTEDRGGQQRRRGARQTAPPPGPRPERAGRAALPRWLQWHACR